MSVRLGRTPLNDMLRGRKFPKKAFMLTFVYFCGIDLEVDRSWEDAWNRLAPQYRGRTYQETPPRADSTATSAGVEQAENDNEVVPT